MVDLNGHSVTSGGSAQGITTSDSNAIRNGIVSGFAAANLIFADDNNRVQNMVLIVEQSGVSLSGEGSVVEDSIITGSTFDVVRRTSRPTRCCRRASSPVCCPGGGDDHRSLLAVRVGAGASARIERGHRLDLEPLTAALIAWLWLHQSLGVWQIVGAAMVLVGIGVVQMERPAPRDVLAERAAIE